MIRIGFIGLGDIGGPMAARLLERIGHLSVWNRTAAKADALLRQGATWATSPVALVTRCHLVGLCLTSDDAVEDVLFGGGGLFGGEAAHRATIVNFSTGAPERSLYFAARAAEHGASWVDAPVSGGPVAARAGALTILLGGHPDAIERAAPMLDALSAHRTHLGLAGAGQAAKLCNQMIVASNLATIAETIAVARAAGIDVARFPAALKGGFADSAPLQLFGSRMAKHDFLPRLGAIGLMAKDVDLARRMAAVVGVNTPMSAAVQALLARIASIDGLSAEDDLSILVRLFEDPLDAPTDDGD